MDQRPSIWTRARVCALSAFAVACVLAVGALATPGPAYAEPRPESVSADADPGQGSGAEPDGEPAAAGEGSGAADAAGATPAAEDRDAAGDLVEGDGRTAEPSGTIEVGGLQFGLGVAVLATGFGIVGYARHRALEKDGLLSEDRHAVYPSEKRPRVK